MIVRGEKKERMLSKSEEMGTVFIILEREMHLF